MLPEAVNNLPPVLRPADPPARPLSELAGRFARRVVGYPADRVVSGVTVSTTDLHAGDVFVALPGRNRHGAEFASGAADTGAIAIVTDPAGAGKVSRHRALLKGSGQPLSLRRPQSDPLRECLGSF